MPKQVFIHYENRTPVRELYRFCPLCRAELEACELDHRYRAVCPDCGYIHYRNPAPVVSLLIVRGEQVLLGRRTGEPGKGLWATVSGYIEYEDDFLTTAIHEAKEETNLDVEIKSILNVHSSFVSEKYHFIGIYLLAEVVGGELAAGDDMEEVAWFPLCGPFPELAFFEDAEILRRFSMMKLEGMAVDPSFARGNERRITS